MRVAILGAGRMGAVHARAYASMPDVEVAGIVARTTDRARPLAESLDVPWFTTPWPLLHDESVEAVDVCLPTALHREYVVAALERGKHVFCETPLAANLADIDAMTAAARQSGRVLGVALLGRFVFETTLVRNEVLAGALGTPRTLIMSRLSPPYATSAAGYGDVLLEMATLDLDYAHWLFGAPRSVYAVGHVAEGGGVLHVHVSVQFPSTYAVIEASALMPRAFAYRTRLRVFCDGGALECTSRFEGEGAPAVALVRYTGDGDPVPLTVASRDPYVAECQHFAKCVRGEADPSVIGPMHARAALEVAEAARLSLGSGQPVSIVQGS